MPAIPTATNPLPATPVHLASRAERTTMIIIPTTYGALHNSLHPGIIAAIVIGAVAGFLLLLFMVYTCLGFGPAVITTADASELSVRPKHHRHHHHRRSGSHTHRHSHGPRVTETVEIRTRERTSGGGGGGNPIIVEPPPPPRVESDEDEVVVIEEHDPPPRRKSRRTDGRDRRRESGYRDGDPDRYRDGGRRSRDHY